MNKLLIICGPTSTGKTELGVTLAKKYNGEIVSADSRQVYKGMDIITGKDLPSNSKLKIQNSKLGIMDSKFSVGFREKDGIPIWLVDIVGPDYPFNVSDYSKLARLVISHIWRTGKLPIVVGGSGLYIKSITDPLETLIIPPNQMVRRLLAGQPISKYQKKLLEVDHIKMENMNRSDRVNPRRLIRAIEIALWQKNTKNQFVRDEFKCGSTLVIGLKSSNPILFKKIEERIIHRLNQGAIEEVRSLIKQKYESFLPAVTASGYSGLKEYINGKITREDLIRFWKFREMEYSRRQMTWFKKDKRIVWYDISKEGIFPKIDQDVDRWYTSG